MAAWLATMPMVLRSARWLTFTRASKSGLVEWNHASLWAARPNDLLAALNVKLLLTMALFGRLANGVYFWPLPTQSQ